MQSGKKYLAGMKHFGIENYVCLIYDYFFLTKNKLRFF